MKYLVYLFFFFLGLGQSYAQTYSIKGVVKESGNGEAVPNASVLIQRLPDSVQVDGMISDLDGIFEITGIRPGDYLLKVQYLGFQTLNRDFNLSGDLDFGTLTMREEATALEEVTISARRSSGTQKRDTTLYNADAFKTMRDASAQTLLEKLPGVVSEEGSLQAQGENIAQILVDGKPFFGTDVKTALQNLPAEVIQGIEIFDQKSEKAQLSGFDDGERLKTINIITKPSSRKGQFGRTSVGYGTDDRYLVGASINSFNEGQRITFTGLSNNINLQDYSSDPNAQDDARPQNGIINTNLAGLNYTDNWGKKIKVTGSYVFNRRENIGQATLFRDFASSAETNQAYAESSNDIRINNRHRFNMRLEYDIDENNRILYIPRLSARFETENSDFFGQTTEGGELINQTQNTRTATNKDYDINNRLLYSRKFNKVGRTMTVRANVGNHMNQDISNRLAENLFFDPEQRTEIINQEITRERMGVDWQTGISFTEALGQKSQLEIEYEIGNRVNDSDQLIFDVLNDEFSNRNLALDTALSNRFESRYLTQEIELGYQFTQEKLRFQVEAQYQHARLNNLQEFPRAFDLNRTFESFLPTMRLEYQFSPNFNMELNYDTRTNAPSVQDLQAVIDNSNPLQLRTGNPDLDQSYTNSLRMRLRGNNPETDQSWFLFAQSNFVNNTISNSSFIAEEPTELQDGIILERGSQLFRPVNLDGYWDFRSWMSYGMPLGFIKSNFNINAGAGYVKRPSMVNNVLGFNNSRRLNTGFSLNSNISDQIDFNVSTRLSFNNVENTLSPSLNNNFFNQRARVNFNWIIWEGIVYRLDLNHQINSGLSEGFDTSFTLVNMSIGKKIFKNQRGEISMNVYDLLAQNNNVRRNITETFIEDTQTNVLQRYFMLTLSYNLRRFSKGMDMDDYNEMVSPVGSRP